jgi:hypothetical protein
MKSVEETARLLADEHRREDDAMTQIYWVPAENEVRLIEVTSAIADRGEVLPFAFTADGPEVPYPSVVTLLSPGDWMRVAARELPLPAAFGGVLTPIWGDDGPRS